MNMVKPPVRYLTQETLSKLLDPGRVFYRVAVDDAIARGELAEIQALIKGAREVKEHYGDLDKLIGKLESAAKKAQV
jgi:Domain of unknown function (DUF1843)